VTDLAKVPTPFQSFYSEEAGEDGTFALRDSPTVKGSVEVITGLTKSLKASRADAKAHKGKAVDLSPLSEFGEDVSTIAGAVTAKIEELQEQVKGGKAAKVNIEKIKTDLATKYDGQIQGRDTRIEALHGQLYRHLVEATASAALGDKVVNQALALPHVLSQVRATEEDGEYKVFVVDAAGDRRFSGVTGKEMSVVELVKEMETSEMYAPLFKSETKRGSGSPPGAPSRQAGPAAEGKKTSVDKIASGLEARSRR
jgi:hypothetical protein